MQDIKSYILEHVISSTILWEKQYAFCDCPFWIDLVSHLWKWERKIILSLPTSQRCKIKLGHGCEHSMRQKYINYCILNGNELPWFLSYSEAPSSRSSLNNYLNLTLVAFFLFFNVALKLHPFLLNTDKHFLNLQIKEMRDKHPVLF